MEAAILSRATIAPGAQASKRRAQVIPLRTGSAPLIDKAGALRPALEASDGAESVTKVPVVTIIDDDESVLIATKSLLRSLGYVVSTFASAEDYLHSPRVNDTACLITDVQMPGMTGLELQRHLLSQGRRTPMIFITAFAEETIRARALEAGAVAFLSKPFDEQTLINCLDRALKGKDDRPTQT